MSGSPQVRRADKLMTEERARETLERGFCGRLATVGEDGWPYCVPLLYVCMDGEVFVHNTRARGHLRANADHEPRVCFEIDEAGEVFAYGRFECDSTVEYRSELVLGIDNVIFISILVDKLPEARRELARRIGLALAMFMRIGLLFVLVWISGLTEPLFTVLRQEISGRDLILMAGGLFLIWKSTQEIHQLLEGEKGEASAAVGATSSGGIPPTIILDILFSFDSIITAVGMVDRIEVMIAAVIVSVLLMMAFAGGVGRFVSAHPTVKMLALAFLFVIGVVLIADGFDHHVPKGYVYFAMAFSVCVEMLNLRMRKRAAGPVELRDRYSREGE